MRILLTTLWSKSDRAQPSDTNHSLQQPCISPLPAPLPRQYGELVRLLVVAEIPPQTLIAIAQCLLVGHSAVVMAPKSVRGIFRFCV